MIQINAPYQITVEQIPIYELREFTSIRDRKYKPDGTLEMFDNYHIHYVRPDYHPIRQWSPEQQNWLIDSLLRKTYIPPIVVREINQKTPSNAPIREVLDGWHRIKTIQDFFGDFILPLPDTVKLLPPFAQFTPTLDGKDIIFAHYYHDLPEEHKHYIKTLTITAHVVKGIETNTAENEKHAKLIHLLLHPENTIL
jgi:hypothetical protein